ncbi:SRPBCC family protein [Actinopolymorpha pittospori]|uniref:Membrane protein n=1 Tax=Actinopolymorpha pittospori TaxID=648752 RepID=A0A927RJF9_9ACTN|nr:SRPBCC family protein [Actinopolymorpha pittospori]MBE1607171.1 putative membrane protein [Actinopolymorpha pittospori]
MSQTSGRRARPEAVNLSDIGDGVRKAASKNPATQRLVEAGQAYVSAKAGQMLGRLGGKVGETTKGLAGVASGEQGAGDMLGRTVKDVLGGASPGKAVAKAGLQGITDKVKGVFKGGGGKGGGKKKSMNIVEDLDLPVPLRMAYNHWTQFERFPTWSKATQSVDLDKEDPTKSNWKAKIVWSNRNWNATVIDQIPDDRISWRTEGQTEVNGVVSFHPLGDELTKMLVVLEYVPHGFFEKTANLWRCQGRRARLDIKFFRRYVTMEADPEEEGWRGEIRDGELVRDHDEVVREEEEEERGRAAEEREPEEEREEEPEGEFEEEEKPEGEEEEEPQAEEPRRRSRPPRQRRPSEAGRTSERRRTARR